MNAYTELDAKARNILNVNDRGGYTVPTARLYPYQWNWDSVFVALGFSEFDRARAWRELETLVEGQWPEGMIPHIIFRRNDPDYFPGPKTWKADIGPIPSGGISQPPVFASIMLELVETGREDDLARADRLFDAALRWHRWWHEKRTPHNVPVIATVHPWETGRDNCPDWDVGLNSMDIDPELEDYTRMDNKHANPDQRPTDIEYDKFITIVKAGRDLGWDQSLLTNQGPFLMADPGLHFILLRADRDLLKLAHLLGRRDAVADIENFIEKGLQGTSYLWNERIKGFCARDIRSGAFANGFSSASTLCFYADAGNTDERHGTLYNIERIAKTVSFLMPSWDPDSYRFDPQRYWCGPVWPQMNRIIAKGLLEQGEYRLGDRVKRDLSALIRLSGFWECFNTLTGDGCIGRDFSWTAAMWLYWLREGEKE